MITVATETKNNVSNFQEIQESDYLFVFIFHHLKSTKGEKKPHWTKFYLQQNWQMAIDPYRTPGINLWDNENELKYDASILHTF